LGFIKNIYFLFFLVIKRKIVIFAKKKVPIYKKNAKL